MKDLPYFKFDAESWLTGKIQLLPVEEIGIFVNLMARIWKAGGTLKNDRFLPRMLGTDKEQFATAITDFLDLEIIEEVDGYISIKFITEQLADRAAFIERCSKGGQCRFYTTESVEKFVNSANLFLNESVDVHHTALG